MWLRWSCDDRQVNKSGSKRSNSPNYSKCVSIIRHSRNCIISPLSISFFFLFSIENTTLTSLALSVCNLSSAAADLCGGMLFDVWNPFFNGLLIREPFTVKSPTSSLSCSPAFHTKSKLNRPPMMSALLCAQHNVDVWQIPFLIYYIFFEPFESSFDCCCGRPIDLFLLWTFQMIFCGYRAAIAGASPHASKTATCM